MVNLESITIVNYTKAVLFKYKLFFHFISWLYSKLENRNNKKVNIRYRRSKEQLGKDHKR